MTKNISKKSGAPPSMEGEKFWAMRAKRYEKLEWVNKGSYLHAFLNSGRFTPNDIVLDVGTGTGIIAQTLAPHVREVVGIDISQEMLDKAAMQPLKNARWIKMDTHRLQFPDEMFDKITARMVFHHVIRKTRQAMSECHRVLRRGGTMVFSEGVPPTEHVKPFFTKMFKLKEKRITFMEPDLIELMHKAGFKKIKSKILFVRQASIKNWLVNSGIPQKNQDRIFQMHLDLDEQGKKDYKMTIKDNDCFIDMKFVILTGQK